MKTSVTFKSAAEVIRKGWCQGAMARDCGGSSVEIHSEYAVSYCARGALSLKYDSDDLFKINDIIYRKLGDIYGESTNIGWWNDQKNQTQENVAKMVEECEREAGFIN